MAATTAVDEQIARPQQRMPRVGQHGLRRLLQPGFTPDVGLLRRGHLDGPCPAFRRRRQIALRPVDDPIPEELPEHVEGRPAPHAPPAQHQRAATGGDQVGRDGEQFVARPCRSRGRPAARGDLRQAAGHAGLQPRQQEAPRTLARRREPLAERRHLLADRCREQRPRGDGAVAGEFVEDQQRIDERGRQRQRRRRSGGGQHDRAVQRAGEFRGPLPGDRGLVAPHQSAGVDADRSAGRGRGEPHHGEAPGRAVADGAGIPQPAGGRRLRRRPARARQRLRRLGPAPPGTTRPLGGPRRSDRQQLERQVPEHPVGHDHQFVDAGVEIHLRLVEQQPLQPLRGRLPVTRREAVGRHRGDGIEQAQRPGQHGDLLGDRRRLPHLPGRHTVVRLERRQEAGP